MLIYITLQNKILYKNTLQLTHARAQPAATFVLCCTIHHAPSLTHSLTAAQTLRVLVGVGRLVHSWKSEIVTLTKESNSEIVTLTKESSSEIVTLTKESNSEIVTITKESASKTSDS